MIINLHDKLNFEKIAIFEDYISLIWCKRYNEIGAVDIEVDANEENLHLFQKDRFITRDDDDSIYRINALEVQTNADGKDVLIVGAIDCKEILNQRIILYYMERTNADLSEYLEEIINDNVIIGDKFDGGGLLAFTVKRRISWFSVDSTELKNILITDKCRFEQVADKIIELGNSYDFGWKTTKNWEIKFYKGKDLSNIVIFKPDYDNVGNTKYKISVNNYKNFAYVTGDGEDYEKVSFGVIKTGSQNGLNKDVIPSGIFRYETEINATDQNGEIFISKGVAELKEKKQEESFEGEILQTLFTYKKDYNLGDIVTIENKYGINVKARIIEIIESWDESGYTLEPKFEYFESEDDALLSEMNVLMETENGENIIADKYIIETSDEIVNNIKNSSIVTEENVMLLDENDELLNIEV